MRVYAVITLKTDPHGEVLADGHIHGVFASRKSANAYMRDLRDCDEFNGGYCWQYAVRSFKVED